MIKEIKIPNIGENVEAGSVVDIKVAKGDLVEQDQTIIEFETDKALVEIPAPEAGKITEISVRKGDTLKVGDVVGKIDTEGKPSAAGKVEEAAEAVTAPEEPDQAPAKAPEREPETPAARPETKPEPGSAPTAAPTAVQRTGSTGEDQGAPDKPKREAGPAAPSVRRLARELGANIEDITGTGPGGRITFDDVKAHVKEIVTASKGVAGPAIAGAKPLPDFSKWGEVEIVKMSRVRQVIAGHVSNAWLTVPHVTQFDKADITEVEKFRAQFGKQAEKKNARLTVTAILLHICARALKQFPKFNASIDPAGEQMIHKKYYHIGIATDTDRGLLVPVIRDVDQKSIVELATILQETSDKARSGKLTPDDMEGGTFTISNQGSIGGVDFTPIVSWPQVAILGVSRGSMQPVFIDGEFKPRMILPLSLSYDHRIIDGADAARFLKWIKDALEHPLLINFE